MIQGTMNHSGHVLVLAKRALERSRTSASEAEVAITLSVVAFEGFLNEAAHTARGFAGTAPQVDALFDVLEEADAARVQLLAKYRFAMYALTGRFPSKGGSISRELEAAIRIRNGLMHLRPEAVFLLDHEESSDQLLAPPKEVRYLISAGVIDGPLCSGQPWRHVVATPAVAEWAIGVTTRAILSVVESIPDGYLKQVLAMTTRGLIDPP